jgi:hypothetical protein
MHLARHPLLARLACRRSRCRWANVACVCDRTWDSSLWGKQVWRHHLRAALGLESLSVHSAQRECVRRRTAVTAERRQEA